MKCELWYLDRPDSADAQTERYMQSCFMYFNSPRNCKRLCRPEEFKDLSELESENQNDTEKGEAGKGGMSRH